jgi:hypothetical protein
MISVSRPKFTRQTRGKRLVTPADVLTLCCGSRLLHDSFNGELAAMQAAWRDPDVRARVYARQKARHNDLVPWAALAFGEHGERLPTREHAEEARLEYQLRRDARGACCDSHVS